MDILTRGTALAGAVRVFCCRTTDLTNDAVKRHDLHPTSAAALGRTLAMGAIMGCMLKTDEEKIEIQINGKGPLGQMVVDGYSDGRVRGYVDNPHIFIEKKPGKLDVGQAVGTDGFLRIVKDMGMKQPFVSEVQLQTGELGDDFAYYYLKSEQTASAVCLGVLVDTDKTIKSAGALVIQMMPSAVDADIDHVEDMVNHLKPISQLIDEFDSPKEIVEALFDDYEELGSTELKFQCECSRTKYAQILHKLQKKDLQAMVDEDHGCEVVCKFCGKKYQYSEETLQGFINSKK